MWPPTHGAAPNLIDFWVVSVTLGPFVEKVSVVPEAPVHPHSPVILQLGGLARRMSFQRARKCRRFPLVRPLGPAQVPNVTWDWAVGTLPPHLDAAVAQWWGHVEAAMVLALSLIHISEPTRPY